MSSKSIPFATYALAAAGLSLATFAVSQTSTQAQERAPEDQVVEIAAPTCSIETSKVGRGTAFEATVVAADEAISGTYKLSLTRKVGSNRSKISSGGSFVAAAGETTVLTKSVFNSVDGVTATLSLDTDQGDLSCDYPPAAKSS